MRYRAPLQTIFLVVSRSLRGQAALLMTLGLLAAPLEAQSFRRGDANADSTIDLADPVAMLFYLFIGNAPPSCVDAVDVNDDGITDLSDPLGILKFLFRSGDAPAAPFRECGVDPTSDGLTCESFSPCGGEELEPLEDEPGKDPIWSHPRDLSQVF